MFEKEVQGRVEEDQTEKGWRKEEEVVEDNIIKQGHAQDFFFDNFGKVMHFTGTKSKVDEC